MYWETAEGEGEQSRVYIVGQWVCVTEFAFVSLLLLCLHIAVTRVSRALLIAVTQPTSHQKNYVLLYAHTCVLDNYS